MTEAEHIARGLTEAQRRLVLALDAKEFRDWKARSRNRRTRDAVAHLTEYMGNSVITLFFMRRLNERGLAVRHHLLTEKRDG